MRIVEILARANSPMRLSDIARDAEIPASTTLRMVNTLVECGYAYQEENGSQGYGLTMRRASPAVSPFWTTTRFAISTSWRARRTTS